MFTETFMTGRRATTSPPRVEWRPGGDHVGMASHGNGHRCNGAGRDVSTADYRDDILILAGDILSIARISFDSAVVAALTCDCEDRVSEDIKSRADTQTRFSAGTHSAHLSLWSPVRYRTCPIRVEVS